MAGVTTYSCTKCRPIDTEIIQAYLILSNTSKMVSEQEADRVTAENGRVDAEAERTRVFAADHGTAQDDHVIAAGDHITAGDDHLIAVADHGTAGDDHTLAAGDHVTAGEDHLASTSATSRANDAAAAAEHMVDIHQGPPGDDGKSAYEIAVEEGFVGTEEQWVASLKGRDGNPGSSQDYPFELVNNEETDDSTKAHTAQGAKRLKDEITQLEHEVHSLPRGKDYGFFTSSANLPQDATEEGFAYVGATEPYAIWQFDGTSWSDSGVTAVAFAAPQDQVKEAVDDYLDEHPTVSGTFTNTAKRALIALLEKVAYIDGDGQSYIDILNVALNDVPIDHIDAVFTQGDLKVYDGFSTLNDLKANLVVTAYYADGSTAVIPDYELSGTLTAGASTITVTVDEEFTDTFTVAVTATTKLYMDGDECTANSGGWQVKGFYKTAGSPVTSKESDHLLIRFNSSATEAKTFSTINKVDIDTNTVILVECEPWTGAGTGIFWAYYPSTLADSTSQESAFGADYADNRDSLADASLAQMTGQSRVVRKTITATHTEAYISLNLNLWSSPSAGAYVKITKVALAAE